MKKCWKMCKFTENNGRKCKKLTKVEQNKANTNSLTCEKITKIVEKFFKNELMK